jgi:2-hydroxychromene-2-carboxylate isomerase
MIEFFFDCSSPWTYLAFHNILPLAREFDEGIDWRPILVGGICNKINPSVYQARERPVPARTHDDYAAACAVASWHPPAESLHIMAIWGTV